MINLRNYQPVNYRFSFCIKLFFAMNADFVAKKTEFWRFLTCFQRLRNLKTKFEFRGPTYLYKLTQEYNIITDKSKKNLKIQNNL